MRNKLRVKKQATVSKIIEGLHPSVPEMVEIVIQGADDLYREIRIENALQNKRGEQLQLKKGARLELVFEVAERDTVLRKGDRQILSNGKAPNNLLPDFLA